MRPLELSLLVGLAAIWGASFIMLKIITPVLGPIAVVEGRALLGSLVLLIYALWIRSMPQWRKNWRIYALLGFSNVALPFFLLSYASLHLPAAMATILNATAPLFAATLTVLWLKSPFMSGQWVGLALGILGVSVLVGWSPVPLTLEVILGVLAMLGTTLCYAWSTVYIRKQSHAEGPLGLVLGQLVYAAAYLLLPTLVLGTPQTPQPLHLGLLLALGVLATALGNLIFFYLVARSGPTQASSVGFLVPVFGIIWAVIFLREHITWSMMVGMGIILASVALVNQVRLGWRGRKVEGRGQ